VAGRMAADQRDTFLMLFSPPQSPTMTHDCGTVKFVRTI